VITSEEIKRRLWNGANELRGSMDASRYKDYMLGLMFYKFLSDNTLDAFKTLSGTTGTQRELLEQYEAASESYAEQLYQGIQTYTGGYYVLPEYTYQAWLRDIDRGDFAVDKVSKSLDIFERTLSGEEAMGDFKGLFSSSTLDLNDTALGTNLKERSNNIKALIGLFADLDMTQLQDGDVLGDAYEYLIGQFAMESGKKAGEFYTPHQVSEVMAQIVATSDNIESIYDPAVGSGSLLLTVGRHLTPDAQRELNYYGQEKNTATYNLARMNLLLHGVRPAKMTIRNADTLAEDWPEDPTRPNEGVLFDAVVMNPPYSLKNWNRSEITVSDPRFAMAGVLPPASKGDYAFLLHGLFHLNPKGTMAIVLPHGVLFRGGSEGIIRQRLLEKNYIDAIIGMPSNLFTNTGIPVVIIILKKNRPLDAPILFIDASEGFEKVGKQNKLREKDIARIVDTFIDRTEYRGYSHLAQREEIIANEFNLNIPRYVELIDDEIPHDVDAHLYGGIPEHNIKDLLVLQDTVPDVMQASFDKLREGYYTPNKSIDQFTEDVLNAPYVIKKAQDLNQKALSYSQKYFTLLKNVTGTEEIRQLHEQMLSEIKSFLTEFAHIDIYDGYQIIADIWKQHLMHDLELIAIHGFYTAARQRVPRMVTKTSGKKKRQEQDGWEGAIIPNSYVKHHLYQDELNHIDTLNQQLAEFESALDEYVDAAKDEDSEEYDVLFDTLKRNKDDEPQNNFHMPSVNRYLKKYEKNSEEYQLLNSIKSLDQKIKKHKKQIKKQENELEHDVQHRIPDLTDQEIDTFIYEKWFRDALNRINSLIETPLQRDITTLKTLHDRYDETIDDLDAEIAKLEQELAEMLRDLVKTDE
jgi:type I restriction enzyme M protein